MRTFIMHVFKRFLKNADDMLLQCYVQHDVYDMQHYKTYF